MKHFKKLSIILSILFISILMFSTLALQSYAIEEVVEPDANVNTSLEDIEFIVQYTSDSVVTKGLTYQTYVDPISNQTGVEIVPSFGIGYAIYDNPDTDIIDGIRINGQEVTSLRIPMSSEQYASKYVIAVRTVYLDSASGTLAQILDGTYDYTLLLTNPVILFQLAYWIFMASAGFIGLIYAIRSKGKKIKTSDEIAAKVTENSDEFRDRIVNVVTEVIKAEIVPLAQASVQSGKDAVKAILISNSKSKEAPSALLDVFKDAEDIDIAHTVENARETLSECILKAKSEHGKVVDTLHDIANHVIQEDVENAKTTETKPHKSVF